MTEDNVHKESAINELNNYKEIVNKPTLGNRFKFLFTGSFN